MIDTASVRRRTRLQSSTLVGWRRMPFCFLVIIAAPQALSAQETPPVLQPGNSLSTPPQPISEEMVIGEDITVTQSPIYMTNGTTWPYQDMNWDRRRYGTPADPLEPHVGNAAFFTPFLRESYLGAGHLGGLQAGFFLGQVRGAPQTVQVNWNYSALQTLMSATTNLGGTAPNMSAGRGQIFGFSPMAVLYSGATDILNVTGGEINIQVNSGASVAYKSGLQIVAGADDAVQGSEYDAGLSISNQKGAIGFRHGILFSAANGQSALSLEGTLLGAMDKLSMAKGIDLSDVSFSTSAFASKGFSVDGTGIVRAQQFTTESPEKKLTLGGEGVKVLSIDTQIMEPVHSDQALGTATQPWGTMASIMHQLVPTTYERLPACNSGTVGTIAFISDARAPITTWRQPIKAGGGDNKTLAVCLTSDWVSF